MSPNEEAVTEVFKLARRADHRTLRTRLHDDVTWHPASTGKWNPCMNVEEVVRTLLWRAEANRLRPGEMIPRRRNAGASASADERRSSVRSRSKKAAALN